MYKPICKRCVSLWAHITAGHDHRESWNKDDDVFWDDGVVWCPYIGKVVMELDGIPKDCIYFTEQFMADTTKTKV